MAPIFLSADSRPWFDRDSGAYRQRVRDVVAASRPRACYLGAATGEAPEFYEMFCTAMGRIGIDHCEHVRAGRPEPIRDADLVLLSGGDVGLGWRAR